ncbi:hypothetical protein MMC09_000961 [Bachmanniomyces sp. S44760]|nr:hypothetical protein [Bachmanniomyces sp. S44760]
MFGYESRPYTISCGDKGYIKGVTLHDPNSGNEACHRFGGIPYALPLTNERGWRRALPLPKHHTYGTRDAPDDFSGLSSACPQAQGQKNPSTKVSEDCLQCNIWIPAGKPPFPEGWPVWIYIHGGFLQSGSPNNENVTRLLSETSVKCIIVMPVYRLNVFGFLASHELLQEEEEEAAANTQNTAAAHIPGALDSSNSVSSLTVGNLGFWDQRLALEWTFQNIHHFKGNPQNITLGGMSAGAYSTFHQLAYEASLPDEEAHIRRVIMWSNGCGVQPKTLEEVQSQFDELVSVLEIPRHLPAIEKLARLRAKSPRELLVAVSRMKQTSFRAITDGVFVQRTLFRDIHSGKLGATLRRRGIQILSGDLPDEHNLYEKVNPPHSFSTLVQRLQIEYPASAVQRIVRLYYPSTDYPYHLLLQSSNNNNNDKEWKTLFGKIYTDVQVYVTLRGLVSCLADEDKGLPLASIHRYRIAYRPACVDETYSRSMGVTHASDLAIWFFGNGHDLVGGEKEIIRKWLDPLGAFLRGEDIAGVGDGKWGTGRITQVRTLTEQGTVEVREDGEWERCLGVWNALNEGKMGSRGSHL